MPLPYLGSKARWAKKLYNAIASRHEKWLLIDLFCGGLAISEEFIKNGWSVQANDANKYIIALAKKAMSWELSYDVFTTQWVSREDYKKVQDNKDQYEDWYVWYIQCVWSFGNNQKDYVYGKLKEQTKLAGHKIVIDKSPELLMSLFPHITQEQVDWLISLPTIKERRISLKKIIWERTDLELLEHLERLQHLERLERLQHLPSIPLTSLDYRDVVIPQDAVVYCDPPYKGTTEYAVGGFDHDIFWDYVRNLSQKHSVYVSEYQAPDDFECIFEYEQKSIYSASGVSKTTPNEKLFILRK